MMEQGCRTSTAVRLPWVQGPPHSKAAPLWVVPSTVLLGDGFGAPAPAQESQSPVNGAPQAGADLARRDRSLCPWSLIGLTSCK